MNPCPRCGAPLEDPWPPACPSCGAPLSAPPPPPPTVSPVLLPPPPPFVPPAPDSAVGPAWERQGDVFRRIVDTTTAVLGTPTDFFRRMPPASPTPAVLYAALVGGLSMLVSVSMEFGLQSLLGIAFQNKPPQGFEALGGLFMGSSFVAMVLVQLGVFLARLFVWSAIAHGLLTLLGAPRGTFEATLRVFCYAHATHLLTILPFCGTFVALVYFLVVVIIGLSEVHGVTGTQAAIAVLTPLLICCCCCFAGAAAVIGPLAAALGAAFGNSGL